MRDYKQDHAIVNGWISKPTPNQDTSRSHAVNYAAGVALIAFCGYVLGWSIVKLLWEALPNSTIFLCVPVALLLGAYSGGFSLIRFTSEHRDWLYAIEEKTGIDLNRDNVVGDPIVKVGELPEGTMIRGIDGQLHRIDTTLSKADIHAVKASMLSSGVYGVRAIDTLLGDHNRASLLRGELYALGILERPKERSSTPLTEPGRKAVQRWS